MVNARLHLICGNCGSDDQFEYKINDEIDDETDKPFQSVSIICNNCHTIHGLDDNAVITPPTK